MLLEAVSTLSIRWFEPTGAAKHCCKAEHSLQRVGAQRKSRLGDCREL